MVKVNYGIQSLKVYKPNSISFLSASCYIFLFSETGTCASNGVIQCRASIFELCLHGCSGFLPLYNDTLGKKNLGFRFGCCCECAWLFVFLSEPREGLVTCPGFMQTLVYSQLLAPAA